MADVTRTVQWILKAQDESSGAFEKINAGLDSIKRHMEGLRGVGDIAIGSLLGGLGIQGIDAAIHGVTDFGKSMIDANSQIELMRQRLNILYQSTAEGAQAFAFLKQNELTKPFDIQSIMQASVQLVAFHQDIVRVLPALEDVAGAMGQSLPKAAQAFTDAMAGRFAMMKRDLGISKEELVQFGLQMNKTGHVTDPNSFVSSFLALADSSKFKGGADKLSQTWMGLMSSMSSQWMYFKANIGQGAFGVLEQQLSGLVHTLQNPANAQAIQQFEQTLGAGLGRATTAAIDFGQRAMPYVGSAIALVARAWPIFERGVGAAFTFAGAAVSGFANWLQGTGFPAIEKVINAIGNAWNDVAPVVSQALIAIGGDLSGAFIGFGMLASGFFQALAGAFTIGMGAAQAIFGGALDILSGNWAGFQNDFNSGTNLIIKGATSMVAGISIAMLPMADALMGPWTKAAQGIRSITEGIGGIVGALVGTIVQVAMRIDQQIANMINGAMHMAQKAQGWLPQRFQIDSIRNFRDLIPTATAEGAGQQAQNAIQQWFNQHAPGIGPNQQITAGVTREQATADILARQQQILRELGIAGGVATGKSYSTTGGVGRDVLDQIKALFAGLGGTFTMKDLLTAMGLTDLGKGKLGYTGPGLPGSLPVLGAGPTADAAAGGALGAGLRATTGRVPLGALGATFMQTVATSAGIHAGTDPATRAAQQQASIAQGQYTEEQRHTTLLGHAVDALHKVSAQLEAIAKGSTLPHPTPINALASHGVFRPNVG